MQFNTAIVFITVKQTYCVEPPLVFFSVLFLTPLLLILSNNLFNLYPEGREKATYLPVVLYLQIQTGLVPFFLLYCTRAIYWDKIPYWNLNSCSNRSLIASLSPQLFCLETATTMSLIAKQFSILIFISLMLPKRRNNVR